MNSKLQQKIKQASQTYLQRQLKFSKISKSWSRTLKRLLKKKTLKWLRKFNNKLMNKKIHSIKIDQSCMKKKTRKNFGTR